MAGRSGDRARRSLLWRYLKKLGLETDFEHLKEALRLEQQLAGDEAWIAAEEQFISSGRLPADWVEQIEASGGRKVTTPRRKSDIPQPVPGDEGDDALIASLAEGASSASKPADVLMDWVAQNIEIPWLKIEGSTIPNRAAVAMLRWAKGNIKEFFLRYLPSQQGRGDDALWTKRDGRRLEGLLNRLAAGSGAETEETAPFDPLAQEAEHAA
jgi:hypothetical protein